MPFVVDAFFLPAFLDKQKTQFTTDITKGRYEDIVQKSRNS